MKACGLQGFFFLRNSCPRREPGGSRPGVRRPRPGGRGRQQFTTLELLEKAKAAMDASCQQHDVELDLIRSGSRTGRLPKHRAELAIKSVTEMGLSLAAIACGRT